LSARDTVGVSGCLICAKHVDMPASVVAAEEHVVVSHLPPGAQGSVYLGYLFVEARRHVPELGDLRPDEAAAVGTAAARWSRALQDSEGAEHVYAAVIGHGIAHFHLHLIPRYPGTPREFWWTRVDEWPGAPRGSDAEIAALVGRLHQIVSNATS
jgi:diadenosine tetraphosphate (Ap4A) HIT family hydrolase